MSPPPQRAQANGRLRVGPVVPPPPAHMAHAWGMGRFRTLVTKLLCSKPGAEALGRNGEKKSESGKANFRLGFDGNEGRECSKAGFSGVGECVSLFSPDWGKDLERTSLTSDWVFSLCKTTCVMSSVPGTGLAWRIRGIKLQSCPQRLTV